ncbi:GTF1 [Candida pseudojiufengensis]|uniref:GTF1 n=1 Tax=Candida pseudojiufengensis TaxID=497109 RepID=UPI0022253B8F|nr:GTF1 [Candida pseudojiufengensis]KAI5964355.1 GTF1 [Candida pseudojiufengensis]
MHQTNILNQIITKQTVHKIINTPTWSIKKLRQQIIPKHLQIEEDETKEEKDIKIHDKELARIKKIIKLSGFNYPKNEELLQKLSKSLEIQKIFIKHLYDNSINNSKEQTNKKDDSFKEDKNFTKRDKKLQELYQFRLISSDHLIPKPLKLNELLNQIRNLPNEINDEKGEKGFNFSKLRN